MVVMGLGVTDVMTCTCVYGCVCDGENMGELREGGRGMRDHAQGKRWKRALD